MICRCCGNRRKAPTGGSLRERCLAGFVLAQAAEKNSRRASRPSVRVGFVPLLHAAPLIVAHEWRYFDDEGVRVSLNRQIGWGNIRDKLVYGQLEVSQALLGMPPASVLGRDRFSEPLIAVMSLGAGGNAIALSERLTSTGIASAADLARRLGPRPRKPLVFAHVFGCSNHHYFLRDWLASGGIDPDGVVRLVVLPPPQMARQMENGYLDGFCVGEPWSTVAKSEQAGVIAAKTADMVPSHPEKVLVVARRWLAKHEALMPALIRALLRACAACEDPANRSAIVKMLAQPQYLDLPAKVLADSFALDHGRGQNAKVTPSFAASLTFPSATHMMWLLGMMRRWEHISASTDVRATAQASVDSTAYRIAAACLGIECPVDDFPPLRLRDGWFDAGRSQPAMKHPGMSAAVN